MAITSTYLVYLTTIRNTGPNTTFYQQWDMLEKKGENKIRIRTKMIDNLVVFINKLQAANHKIILTIDENDSYGSSKGGVAKLISITNIINPIACTHTLKDILNTYQRGSHKIDFIFISPKMFKCIRSCGITSFNEIVLSDHRVTFLYVDLICFLQK